MNSDAHFSAFPISRQRELEDEFDCQYSCFLKSGFSSPEQYYRLRSFWVWNRLSQLKNQDELRHV